VVGLDGAGSAGDGRFVLNLANGERASARAVVIASGVRYRRPAAANLAAFEGTGVHYWASPLEANLCAGQEVALVGAGNSAGQAVVYLEETRCPLRHLFLFIGADPNTDWLKGSGVALDSKGFVLTGASTDGSSRLLETSVRGVFAIGDVRSGSTKRVAAAVGEGAQAVAALHAFLAENAIQTVKVRATGRV
jgi:thioredoxin reductase (NADPH)